MESFLIKPILISQLAERCELADKQSLQAQGCVALSSGLGVLERLKGSGRWSWLRVVGRHTQRARCAGSRSPRLRPLRTKSILTAPAIHPAPLIVDMSRRRRRETMAGGEKCSRAQRQCEC